MNSLEKRLLQPGVRWVRQRSAFTTVAAGHAFAMYREAEGMRFCGLSEVHTESLLDKRKAVALGESFWISGHDRYHDRMFDTEPSNEFMAQVILNALPELAT